MGYKAKEPSCGRRAQLADARAKIQDKSKSNSSIPSVSSPTTPKTRRILHLTKKTAQAEADLKKLRKAHLLGIRREKRLQEKLREMDKRVQLAVEEVETAKMEAEAAICQAAIGSA
ncbi:hypothetical protein B0H13DRAFT_1850268 [Mycena leptocephala]|nr:hypothetical protein B0H13DRAFT_1850268 [Mycena leptocephala]